MICDMCGSEGQLFKVNVEEAELTICEKCSKFGKIISVVQQPIQEKKLVNDYEQSKTESMDIITENYAEKIRNKRVSLDLTQ